MSYNGRRKDYSNIDHVTVSQILNLSAVRNKTKKDARITRYKELGINLVKTNLSLTFN
jgi:hypothetical protein